MRIKNTNNCFVNIYYLLLFLPTYSITQALIGLNIQNRILWLPLGILLLSFKCYRVLYKFNVPILLLFLFFLYYFLFACINDWNIIIYFGYFVTFMLLFLSNTLVYMYKELYLKFFQLFFICNCLYVLIQVILLNLGYDSLSLIHSNLPAQLESDYSIPVFFMKPFYRYTGLFNESSPFAFYLSICFCFFKCLGSDCRTYKKIAFLLLVFSGSKFAYIFLVLYAILFVKSKIVKIAGFLFLIISFYLFIFNFDYIFELTSGEITSIVKRFSGLDNSMSAISLWGIGLKQSSTGEIPLDMFSILSTGFGIVGLVVILVLIFIYFYMINSCYKYLFALPFVVSVFSSGSLLIIQYSLLSYCLIYVHNYSFNSGMNSVTEHIRR